MLPSPTPRLRFREMTAALANPPKYHAAGSITYGQSPIRAISGVPRGGTAGGAIATSQASPPPSAASQQFRQVMRAVGAAQIKGASCRERLSGHSATSSTTPKPACRIPMPELRRTVSQADHGLLFMASSVLRVSHQEINSSLASATVSSTARPWSRSW